MTVESSIRAGKGDEIEGSCAKITPPLRQLFRQSGSGSISHVLKCATATIGRMLSRTEFFETTCDTVDVRRRE